MTLEKFKKKLFGLLDDLLQLKNILPEEKAAIEKLLSEAITHLNVTSLPTTAKKLPASSIHTGTIYIWTDGACSGNPGPGGWGTIIDINGQRREISGSESNTTNNIMEMTAALEGIKQTPPGSKIVLTTDSQYLVKGMKEWMRNWKKRGWKKSDGSSVLNREIWQALDQESTQREIQWVWVKGHDGHPENERCDELARKKIRQYQQ